MDELSEKTTSFEQCDLISRKAAIDLLKEWRGREGLGNIILIRAEEAIEAFEELPSAERRGHWIFSPSDAIELMFTKPKCSECGFESADGGNYCPNCGARMDGK